MHILAQHVLLLAGVERNKLLTSNTHDCDSFMLAISKVCQMSYISFRRILSLARMLY